MPKASAATSKRSLPTPASSSTRSSAPTSIPSKASVPAISIEQKTTSRSPRSTVGTITEIYDYLRLLYASVGTPHCPNCGRPISRQTAEQIVERILSLAAGERVTIYAPIVRGRKGEFKDLLEELDQQGFRARVDGEMRRSRRLHSLEQAQEPHH